MNSSIRLARPTDQSRSGFGFSAPKLARALAFPLEGAGGGISEWLEIRIRFVVLKIKHRKDKICTTNTKSLKGKTLVDDMLQQYNLVLNQKQVHPLPPQGGNQPK